MNAKWLGVALAAGVAAGCGQGRAIFVVDIYSFLTGTISFVNRTNTGTVAFQVYFDSVANTVYTSAPAFGVTADVLPASTTDSSFSVNLPDALKPLFLASKVYVGIRASATPGGASSPAGPLQGTAKLTALQARIVVQDKIF